MNRRSFLKWANLAGLAAGLPSASAFGATVEDTKAGARPDAPATPKAASPETILLKDYRPQSIYKIPITEVAKAKFPVIDMHSHPYAKTAAEIDEWVRNMDEVGIEKTMILTMSTGAAFDEIQRKYAKHPERFEQAGARGVGEIHDKGQGLRSGKSKAPGMHPDDPRMAAIWDKCGELGMPVSLHVADPIWMYQKMDRHNDGLMNAYEWRLDNQPNIVGLSGMVDIQIGTGEPARCRSDLDVSEDGPA